ncbi:MAG TPA: TAXI family TRAP transporter solute-binding subunit [Burkholderiales bacterium]|nr:TAXI family TRAP transporter solute-binding subunit [Burkholderiales bacterium]
MAVPDHPLFQRKYLAWTLVALAVAVAAVVWLAFGLLKPTPPRVVTMATAAEGSISAELGKRYRELLARDGVELRLSPAAGAVAYVERLRDSKSGVSVAVVPGGITTGRESPELVSLGTLFYEPLWIFSRGRVLAERERLSRKLRISVGVEGSGSRAFSVEFLARLGIEDGRNASLLALPSGEAAEKLVRGEIDAAILLDAWESPLVKQLLAVRDVHLVNAPRADSWVALYPYLNKVVLPAGVADMARDVPPTSVTLLAPKASLVVRKDLHPAIQYLLLQAAAQIHSGPGVFNKAGDFPAPESIDLPLSDQARQFYKTGPPFLQRHLPFWLAILIQQLLVLLIPVLGLLYPLLRFAPAVFAWAMRRKIFRLYRELKLLDDELAARHPHRVEDLTARLERLDEEADRLWLPISFRPLLYQLRMHISLVRERMKRA